MEDEFAMGAIGPEEDDGFDNATVKDAVASIPIPRESEEAVKKEIEFSVSLPNRAVRSFMELYKAENLLEFIIPDMLPRGGMTFLGGLSGTGKTILAIQIVADLVLGRPTMTWKPVEGLPQLRCLMFSLEMSGPECQRRLLDMYPELDENQQKLLNENFFVYSEPEPFELWNVAHCIEMIQLISKAKADVVLLDSASVSFGDSLKDDTQVNQSLKNLYAIRSRLNVAMIVVAHTRKPPPGISSNPEEASINELFGHSGIAQHASSIYLMLEDEKSRKDAIKNGNGDKVDKLVHIVNVKTRFGSSNAAFKAKLTSREDTLKGKPLAFRRDAIELGAPIVTQEQRKQLRAVKKSPLGDLAGIDFGAALQEGEDDI